MSDFNKDDIRDMAVMFANRCRFTTPAYEPHSVQHGFKEGFRIAIEKIKQASEAKTSTKRERLIAFQTYQMKNNVGHSLNTIERSVDIYLKQFD